MVVHGSRPRSAPIETTMRHMAPVMSHQDSRLRAEKAFSLRAIGHTWREIAAELGYKSHGAVQLAVSRYLARTPAESVDTARRSAVESLRVTRALLFDRFAEAAIRGDDHLLTLMSKECAALPPRRRSSAACTRQSGRRSTSTFTSLRLRSSTAPSLNYSR